MHALIHTHIHIHIHTSTYPERTNSSIKLDWSFSNRCFKKLLVAFSWHLHLSESEMNLNIALFICKLSLAHNVWLDKKMITLDFFLRLFLTWLMICVPYHHCYYLGPCWEHSTKLSPWSWTCLMLVLLIVYRVPNLYKTYQYLWDIKIHL